MNPVECTQHNVLIKLGITPVYVKKGSMVSSCHILSKLIIF